MELIDARQETEDGFLQPVSPRNRVRASTRGDARGNIDQVNGSVYGTDARGEGVADTAGAARGVIAPQRAAGAAPHPRDDVGDSIQARLTKVGDGNEQDGGNDGNEDDAGGKTDLEACEACHGALLPARVAAALEGEEGDEAQEGSDTDRHVEDHEQ